MKKPPVGKLPVATPEVIKEAVRLAKSQDEKLDLRSNRLETCRTNSR